MRFPETMRAAALSLFSLAAALHPAHAQTASPSGELTVQGVNYDEERETPFTMYIRRGEMRIDQGRRSMIFRPSGSRPGMLFIDHNAKRVDFLPSPMISAAEDMISATTASRYETPVEPAPGLEALSPIPETVTVIRGGRPEVVSLRLDTVAFFYEGDATLPGMGAAGVPPDMKDLVKAVLRIDSRATVDPRIPGAETAAAFYDALAKSSVEAPAGGFMSMSSGLAAVNRDIASHGFPVWVATETRVRVEVSGPMAGMMEGMLSKLPGIGRTLAVSVVESISTDPVDPALFYDGDMPPGYQVNVIDTAGATP